MRYGDDDTIRRLLTDSRTWAVVGLSDKPETDAYRIAAYLRRQGKRIVPVHPRADTVHGEPGYRSLADIRERIDVVDVFVRSERAGPIADQAVELGLPAVWMQLGVRDDEAAKRAQAAGVDVVMDTCPHIEGPRLLGWPTALPRS
jgi:uncharacterized protein